MGEEDQAVLSERQELLLTKWIDGEGGWLSRFYVGRFLVKRASAKNFLNQTRQVSSDLNDMLSLDTQDDRIDLWDRISSRLDQEEQKEILWGRRSIASGGDGLLSSWGEKLVWGACGACVTAALAVMVVISRPLVSHYSEPQLLMTDNDIELANQGNRIVEVNSDGYEAPASYSRLVSADRPMLSPFKREWEMDWLHSGGSVHLVDDTRGGSAVIWVKKGDRARYSGVYSDAAGNGRLVVVDKGDSWRGYP